MSFLDGMSEQRAAILVQRLLAEMSVNLKEPEYLKSGSRELLSDFLEPDDPVGYSRPNPFHAPEIQALIKYLGVTDNSKNTLLFSLSNMESVDIGASWNKLKELWTDGLDVIGALRKAGDENFSYLVDKVCHSPLECMLKTCEEDLNFADSDESEALYTVTLYRDAIVTPADERLGYHLTREERMTECYLTCSLANIFKDPRETVEFTMDKLRKKEAERLGANRLNLSVFTKIVIHGRGETLLAIPLLNGVSMSNAEITDLKIDQRTSINAKGAKGYTLDFDNLVVGAGSARELREIAKYLPRRAAMKVRGAAVEEALGL
jgi:hypothetical protein